MCMHQIYAFFKLAHLVILIMDLLSLDFDKEGWLVGGLRDMVPGCQKPGCGECAYFVW
jgi:hypothetical protein